MLLFGVEISLVEVIAGFSVITTIILLEVIVIMIALMYQMRAAQRMNGELAQLLTRHIKEDEEQVHQKQR